MSKLITKAPSSRVHEFVGNA